MQAPICKQLGLRSQARHGLCDDTHLLLSRLFIVSETILNALPPRLRVLTRKRVLGIPRAAWGPEIENQSARVADAHPPSYGVLGPECSVAYSSGILAAAGQTPQSPSFNVCLLVCLLVCLFISLCIAQDCSANASLRKTGPGGVHLEKKKERESTSLEQG